MAKRGTLDDNTVWRVEEIKKIPNSDEARKLLLRVKEHADNVLKARGWKVKRLIEICCCERKNMGTNLGVGGWCRGDGPGAAHTIALRLRCPRSHDFVSFEHCLKVMWHEMAHIVHGNHSAAFYQEMDDIARHYELIKSKGQLVGLDGFPIGGGRNADPQRHNPSRAEGRAAGLKAAEARAKKQRVMGGGRLGGGASHKKLSPRGPRPRVVNSGVINDARTGAPIMYYTCQAPTGSITQQRFSSFAKLLDSVGRLADGKQNDRLEHWKRTLLLEKRHTGAKSRSQPVVQARIGMLQRMLDDLFDFPAFAEHPAVRHFLGLPVGN